jgi:ferrous-iron efflux pump FieF
MAVASLATWVLVRFQRRVIAATGSLAVRADALHYAGDLWMNAAVATSLALSAAFDWHRADPIFGLGVAALVGHSALHIARDAIDVLMDREFPDDERDRIKHLVRAHPEVLAMQSLRTRRSGMQPFVQFTLRLDGGLPLREAHRICDEVEAEVRRAFPGAEVMVHPEPAETTADSSVSP